MKKIFSLLAMMMMCSSAYAGYATGNVRDYTVDSTNGVVFFTLISEHAERPSCATGQWGQWVLPLTGPNAAAGKVLFAAVLAAFEADRPITIGGNGTCDVWGDRETAAYVSVVRK